MAIELAKCHRMCGIAVVFQEARLQEAVEVSRLVTVELAKSCCIPRCELLGGVCVVLEQRVSCWCVLHTQVTFLG